MPVPPPKNANLVYHGPQLQAYAWDQELFDGTHTTFECVVRPDSATIIPFLTPDTVLLTKQEQPGKPPFFDFPSGIRDSLEESPTKTITREFLEETGYEASSLLEWHTHTNTGRFRFEEFLFLGKDLTRIAEPHLDAGERIETITVSWNDLVHMCLRQELRQPRVMLTILAMEYEPAARARLHNWLNEA